MATQKPIHSLVIDTGPLIKNAISVSTLLQRAECLFTTPAILSEIRDAATRSRVETTLLPFLTIRTPAPASYEVVAEFSKKTGDFAVLSRPDLQILALAYELECERLGGNWRLRSVPGQKSLNGPAPKKEEASEKELTEKPEDPASATPGHVSDKGQSDQEMGSSRKKAPVSDTSPEEVAVGSRPSQTPTEPASGNTKSPSAPSAEAATPDSVSADISSLHISAASEDIPATLQPESQDHESADDDSEGEWITPTNLKKHQAKENGTATNESAPPKQMAVATITTDFAMQNVLLQMNLNLLSNSMQRVKNLRTHILRCHACFLTTKQMDKQFCPRCGQPTLTRVACSTNSNGEFKIHLKKNWQWNHRGERYSIPKPVSGSANGRVNVGGGGKGGGKNGWGHSLILAEDQKEYTRAISEQNRQKHRDLMDEDYLPGILTGDRGRAGGRPKVGAGRNVNSRKRF